MCEVVYSAILAVAAYACHVYDGQGMRMSFAYESGFDFPKDIIGQTEAYECVYSNGGIVIDYACSLFGIDEFYRHIITFQSLLKLICF